MLYCPSCTCKTKRRMLKLTHCTATILVQIYSKKPYVTFCSPK
jgi:hypothetical protein